MCSKFNNSLKGDEERCTTIEKKFVPFDFKNWTPISQIDDLIFLGGIIDARQRGIESITNSPHIFLGAYDISVVISITNIPCKWKYPPNIYAVNFVIPDSPDYNISHLFEQCATILYQARLSNLKSFIHCQMGVSRSTTLLIAFFIKHGIIDGSSPPNTLQNYSPEPRKDKIVYLNLEEIIAYIMKERKYIRPNTGFLMQLILYEKEIYNR
jgi:hypothetical protein